MGETAVKTSLPLESVPTNVVVSNVVVPVSVWCIIRIWDVPPLTATHAGLAAIVMVALKMIPPFAELSIPVLENEIVYARASILSPALDAARVNELWAEGDGLDDIVLVIDASDPGTWVISRLTETLGLPKLDIGTISGWIEA